MSQPDTVSHGERRHYPRIILELPARLDAEGCASVLVVATDISTTGVGLLCDAEGTRVLRERLAAPNSSCDIAIVLPEGYEKDEIRATARVAWEVTKSRPGLPRASSSWRCLARIGPTCSRWPMRHTKTPARR